MNFASDNTAAIAPEILQGIARASDGFALGYGNDDLTQKVARRIGDLFGREAAVFFVSTGTAANALSLAQVTPPWGAVLCHAESHIVTDECGAPEFFGDGLKLIGLDGEGGRLKPEAVSAAIEKYSGHRPHQVNAASLSLTQATEAGTVYRIEEVAALAAAAHAHGLKVHMDGSRIANALVGLNASPAQATWEAGIDVLSFGATKGGALAAEAVVFFDPKIADTMHERRKRGGHLLSKHRFLAAQFDAYLADDCWLRLARHANGLAQKLGAGLAAAGFPPVWPVEANLVFVILPKRIETKLKAAGASFYARNSDSLPAGRTIGHDEVLLRLVTSFATRPDEVDRFVDMVRGG